MAPNGETPAAALTITPQQQKPKRSISIQGLHRALSDLSFELKKQDQAKTKEPSKLGSISEVEEVKCTCCGMSEECTPEYILRVKEKFSGKWICGICSLAVRDELEKNGGDQEEALRAHVSVCVKFNRLGRTQPVLSQAQAMKEMIWRKRSSSISPREMEKKMEKGGIARSSSCIPAITKDIMHK